MIEVFWGIVLATFVLEDLALVGSLALVSQGKISIVGAYLACFVGIVIGDIGLYLLGRAGKRFAFLVNLSIVKKAIQFLSEPQNRAHLDYAVVISRAIPGTRIPTYVGAGLVDYSFIRFFVLTVLSVAAWVMIAFVGGRSLQILLADHWLLSVLLFILFLGVVRSVLPKLANHWDRRAWLQSWRQWLTFEYWPALLFYIPIVPYYIYFAKKNKSFFQPFYANPDILNGGLIGESKWDFLKHLDTGDPTTLKTVLMGPQKSAEQIQELIRQNKITTPYILKPDIGQRGFAVRLIRGDKDLQEYLKTAQFDMILQQRSQFENEAGIFYIRKPGESKGVIFSITDKVFPSVTGDGKSRLGDLILQDQRARIIAGVYFERHRDSLDKIIPSGVAFKLSECGNHCQGAIFLNGNHLKTQLLEEVVDRIAKTMPYFYFGRFDVRYGTKENLKLGKDFEIVEVNGAGSEATHIWDARTTLFEAYKVLFIQWGLLFEVGRKARKLHPELNKVQIWALLKESLRVFSRKEKLSVSS